jgi:hypothetical protein
MADRWSLVTALRKVVRARQNRGDKLISNLLPLGYPFVLHNVLDRIDLVGEK